jgi:hypothetical protein
MTMCTPGSAMRSGFVRATWSMRRQIFWIREAGQEGMTQTATPVLIMAGALVVILIIVLFASVELDSDAVLGVVIGAVVGLVNLAVGFLVLRWALRRDMKTALRVVVGGLLARVIVVAGLMILFQRTGSADPAAFALTFLVFFLVFLGLEGILVGRSSE